MANLCTQIEVTNKDECVTVKVRLHQVVARDVS